MGSPCPTKSNPRMAGTRFRENRSFACRWISSTSRMASSFPWNNLPLRLVFLSEHCGLQRHFGLAPVRYLNLRTLHQVRKALKAADPSVATVTWTAIQFGI
jgi:hypothetical protein